MLEAAFREAGLSPAQCGPAVIGRAVASRPRAVAQAVAVALDCWAIIRRERAANLWERDVPPWQEPLAAARVAEPDPWRESLRDALATRDHEVIARLAEADDLERRPASGLWLLGRLLVWDHQTERAQRALARAWLAHPDDYWINLDLSLFLSFPPAKLDQSLLYNTSSLALRPSSSTAHARRGVLIGGTNPGRAEAEFREALRIWPDYFYAHRMLADFLGSRGRWGEAAEEYRIAQRLNPGRYEATLLRYADALILRGDPKESDPEPTTRVTRFEHWFKLGVIRLRRGDDHGAIEAIRLASRSVIPGTPEAVDLANVR
jgi:tetratricopeptide (TPR) repeat protein